MRILVVEDEPMIALGLSRTLRAASYECDIAPDGTSGYDMAVSGRYDVIILDILLPQLNGFQVSARLRERGVATPILMLTAKSGEWDEAEGLDSGADDYLVKPVSGVVLLAHVRALLRRSHVLATHQLAFEGVTLDPVRRICSYDRETVSLSGREVEVLAYLMRAEGRVVDKGELIRAVWGEDFEGDRNIAEVYVRHLRKKLDVSFGRRIVQTVHGVGYRLHIGEIT